MQELHNYNFIDIDTLNTISVVNDEGFYSPIEAINNLTILCSYKITIICKS
ncbi:hypothetical protein [Mycoplasma leonicaptivi]|uniref:hypothetical protein n=1 Tax=Mycoplasma leonicaptivi TaxID=36742 RepID=UPI000AB2D9DE|nr:hypothetical protein [Mycoplasma leonicaptivi]